MTSSEKDHQDTISKIRSIIQEYRPALEPFATIYKDIHQHPEIGTQEKRTSTIAATHLKDAGYTVVDRIGGYGLVGILKNGNGPTVLCRADMDALPVFEQTGLDYASRAETIDTDGEKKPLMHACGHDMHVTYMMATATLLARAVSRWKGTLMILFQPDEEHGAGAQAMLDDGLYTKVPKPDVVIGQHIGPFKSGNVSIKPGVSMAAADTFKVTVFGRGSHGALPHYSIDPIVLAASMIMRLQTVVSREIAPTDSASVTCASIHGGKAPNVIPYEVEFLLNIRSFDVAVREKVLSSVKRIIKGEAIAAGVEKEPRIESVGWFPLTVNDEATALKLDQSFKSFFGAERVERASLIPGSEDFSLLASSIGVPSVYWNFGGIDPGLWEKYERTKEAGLIPMPHQHNFAPVIEPTLSTAVEAMSLSVLTFMQI